MIASKNYVKKAMENEMLFPLKKYSQNFLINSDIVENIVNKLDFKSGEKVFEIGPGLGALTEQIISKSYPVTVFEIDTRMCEHLRKTFSHFDIFNLEEGDFLKKDLSIYNDDVRVISNLPYALTTPIIEKVLLEIKKLKQFVFMVQKEVIERLNARIKTKEYSPLSIFISYLGNLEKAVNVNKKEFFPVPNVDSTVFSLKIEKERNLEFDNKFYKFLKKCFSMRRKTLINNLSSSYQKDKIAECLISLSLKESARPEELELSQYLEMFNLLNN